MCFFASSLREARHDLHRRTKDFPERNFRIEQIQIKVHERAIARTPEIAFHG